MKKSIIALGLTLFSHILWAQDTLSVKKEEVLGKINEKNLQIKIAEEAYQSAQADYRQSNALFLPNISASSYNFV